MDHWFAARTHPRREPQVAAILEHRGVEVYFPLVPGWRRPDRRAAPAEPLFPGYLFAKLDPGTLAWVGARSAPGISYFLGTPEAPVPLPDELIASIRERAAAQARQRLRPSFKVGDRVTIKSGPFDGLDAIFDCRLNASGRVRVLLAIVRRLTTVELDISYLRPAA